MARDESGKAMRLRRRDFLSLLALAPLAPCMERLAEATTFAGAGDTAPDGGATAATTAGIQYRPLSIGYLEGSEDLDNLAKLAPNLRVLTVVRRGATYTAGRHSLPSREMPAGDPSLVGGAVRLTIHDLYPNLLPADPAAAASLPTAVDVDVLSPMMIPAGSRFG
jgi:hypothetical protein